MALKLYPSITYARVVASMFTSLYEIQLDTNPSIAYTIPSGIVAYSEDFLTGHGCHKLRNQSYYRLKNVSVTYTDIYGREVHETHDISERNSYAFTGYPTEILKITIPAQTNITTEIPAVMT